MVILRGKILARPGVLTSALGIVAGVTQAGLAALPIPSRTTFHMDNFVHYPSYCVGIHGNRRA
jgi:hypothetical protein